jgi:F-type H+-transporting ATPase subunit b
MRFDWWTLALQTVNFAVLVWLLHRFLYKPVLAMIEARQAEVQRQFDEAKATDDKAKAYLATIEAERAAIASGRDAALKVAATQAQEAAEGRRAQAEREAQSLLEGARKTLETEREQALDEARRVAIDLGAEFARRLLAEVPMPLRAEAWIERIERHLGGLEGAERKALTRQLANGAPLTVMTAAPLPAETAGAWRERLGHLLGDGINVAFDVNADLLAGVELHFPTAILRFSWQNTLAELRSQVSDHANAR